MKTAKKNYGWTAAYTPCFKDIYWVYRKLDTIEYARGEEFEE